MSNTAIGAYCRSSVYDALALLVRSVAGEIVRVVTQECSDTGMQAPQATEASQLERARRMGEAVTTTGSRSVWDDAVDAAYDLVEDLVMEHAERRIQEWQWMFRLARRLRTFGPVSADLHELRPAVEAFCDRAAAAGFGQHVDFSDVEARWMDVVHYWHTITYAEGQGPLEIAFEQARLRPILPIPCFSADHRLLVSTAYYLQQLLGDEPILLPVERVGALFGRDKMYGSRLVALARRAGLLETVHPHRYTARQACSYRFVFESRAYRT